MWNNYEKILVSIIKMFIHLNLIYSLCLIKRPMLQALHLFSLLPFQKISVFFWGDDILDELLIRRNIFFLNHFVVWNNYEKILVSIIKIRYLFIYIYILG